MADGSDKPTFDERISAARTRLAANIGALRDRAVRIRKLVSPGTYLDNAWVRVGLGIAVGYALGRRRRPKQLASPGPAQRAKPRSIADDLVIAAVRAAVTSVAGAVVRRAIVRAISDRKPSP